MTNEFELADDTRAKLIFEKQDLLGPMMPGMVPAPHPMVEGLTEARTTTTARSAPRRRRRSSTPPTCGPGEGEPE